MKEKSEIFLEASEIAMDRRHRQILNFNISRYDQAVNSGKKKYRDFKNARDYASEVKDDVLHHLEEYLDQFSRKIESRGAHVFRASDSQKALEIILNIIVENQAKLAVKSKSMVTEEISFNEFAGRSGVKAVETDLGEFIVQVAGEKPYHILTPAMHKSKEDVAALFHREFGLPEQSAPSEIASFVRNYLRKIFPEADIGVTGANFLVADIGGIGLTENEGNGCMTVSFPRIHLVIAGMERVLPSVSQLPFFYQWLAVHGTGQNISAYNSLISGPATSTEHDGPEKMFVILLDNRRSRIMAEEEYKTALKCIRCGSCLSACPVYTNVGGYTFGTTYTGPIGSVITPFLENMDDFGHLPFACSLCGKCSEVCPVKIPLHELMLLLRKKKVEESPDPIRWKGTMKLYSRIFMKRKRLEMVKGNMINSLKGITPDPLGKYKNTADLSPSSFSKLWKIQNR